MTLVGTALNLISTDVLHNTSNVAISRFCIADGGEEIDKSEKRTCRACKAIVFSPLYMLICAVLVAVAVVVASASCCGWQTNNES